MCGIAGWIGEVEEPARLAPALADRLRHRGPDGARWKWWAHAGLVHTRLRVIDLSDAASQPMTDDYERVWTVFNGEIYNHGWLRRLLEAGGHSFRSRSDGEVVPHLHRDHGAAFASRLHGMFACASYEPSSRSLLLARDRFGIKPLFYASTPTRLVFASEIGALAAVPGVDLTPDAQAISDYLSLFFIPAPQTFYRGIRALPPGHVLTATWRDGRVATTIAPFHEWTTAPSRSLSLRAATDRAAELLDAAVGRQLESDVPLGSLLSGGIDSSLVSAAAQKAAGNLRTFTVRFPDAAHDESDAACAVSDHIGSHHELLDFEDGAGTWDAVTSLLRHAGQPFADTSLFAVHAVCRAMRPHVTVALSGDGGDEAFGGYPAYLQLARLVHLTAVPAPLTRFGALLLAGPARAGTVPAQLPARLRLLAGADDVSVVEALRCWVRADEHARLSRITGVEPVRRHFEPVWTHELPRNSSALARISALLTEVDVRLVLPDDMLFKVDIASMREGLEVRVPMLDEQLFEFGLMLPHALKAGGGEAKRVLRAVAARRLPRTIARRPKHGFTVPVDRWATPALRMRIHDALADPRSPLADCVNPDEFRPWLAAFRQDASVPDISREGLYGRVVMLLALCLFLQP
ncbi:MAG TPA: asparagine synthase (glutamine-hydrolyzing) [Vicinamibacterales bacterium]